MHINKWGEIQKGESAKNWVTQVFGKSSTDQTKVLDGKVGLANDNINEQQITADMDAREEANAKLIMDAIPNNNQSVEHQTTKDKSGLENKCNNEKLINNEVAVSNFIK